MNETRQGGWTDTTPVQSRDNLAHRNDTGSGQPRGIDYQALVEQIPAVVYTQVVDESAPTGYRDSYVSPQLLWMIGYTQQEWSKDPELWIKTIHPQDRDAVLAKEAECNKTGRAFQMEYRKVARDGRVLWVRDEAKLITDPATGIQFWQGVMLDITEARQAQEQGKQAEARYQALVETIPAMTYIDPVNQNEPSIYVSPQIESLLGYTPAEWKGDLEFWRHRVHPDDIDRAWEEYRWGRTSDGPFSFEYRMIRRDGRVIWVRDQFTLLRNEAGRPWLMQGVISDITALKDVQEKLRDALERERDAAAELRALDEMKNSFLSAVSHELRTPLTVIIGTSTTLETQALGEETARAMARAITANGRKLERLLRDLLDVERLRRGILQPSVELTNLSSLVASVVEEAAGESAHAINLDLGEVRAIVDPAKVERIVENLLANAFRHTPAGTRVWVSLSSEDEGSVLVVEDDGPGVPEELRASIFEPFQQANPGPSPGTGIGLSLVTQFAKLHGGRAWVEERDGGGASFHVFLPNPAAPRHN